MAKMRLMTQNLWVCFDNLAPWEELGLDCSAEVRMKANVQVFRDILPDVIGAQELRKDMQQYLMLACHEAGLAYTFIWAGDTPILYRAERFELLDTDFILYPEHIDGIEGSVNNNKTKSVGVAVFRDKQDGKIFVFATTHLWYKKETERPGSDAARLWQIQKAIALIDKYQKKYNGCPAILVGDMNARYAAPNIQYALSEGGYSHAHDVATDFRHEGVGYNDCSRKGPGTAWREGPFENAIDHILVKDIGEGAISRFDRYCPDYYLTISDHAPAYIDIEL